MKGAIPETLYKTALKNTGLDALKDFSEADMTKIMTEANRLADSGE
jgi:hypothetical protein